MSAPIKVIELDPEEFQALTPEQDLLISVLYQSVRDCFDDSPEIRANARGWIMGLIEPEYPYFTFRDCCVHCEISSTAIERIQRLCDDKSATRPVSSFRSI